MRWGKSLSCLIGATVLLLITLEPAVTACDCDFQISVEASEGAMNQFKMFGDLNESYKENIKDLLENSDKVEEILQYFGLTKDDLMYNLTMVRIFNESDMFILVPLNVSSEENPENGTTVNVTDEIRNETGTMNISQDFVALIGHVSQEELVNVGWIEEKPIASGLLVTISPNGNWTLSTALAKQMGLTINTGGIVIAGTMSLGGSGGAAPPIAPTAADGDNCFEECMDECLEGFYHNPLYWVGLAGLWMFALGACTSGPSYLCTGSSLAALSYSVAPFPICYFYCKSHCGNDTASETLQVEADFYITESGSSMSSTYEYDGTSSSFEVTDNENSNWAGMKT